MSSSFHMRNMRVRFSVDTHIGMKRKHNEDSFIRPTSSGRRSSLTAWAATLAEGGLEHGSRRRSRLSQGHAGSAPTTRPFKMDQHVRYETNQLVVGVGHANQRIWRPRSATEEQHGMGTTIVGALFLDDRVIIARSVTVALLPSTTPAATAAD